MRGWQDVVDLQERSPGGGWRSFNGGIDPDMVQLNKMMTAEVMKMTADKTEKKLVQAQQSGGASDADIQKAVHAHQLGKNFQQMDLGHFQGPDSGLNSGRAIEWTSQNTVKVGRGP